MFNAIYSSWLISCSCSASIARIATPGGGDKTERRLFILGVFTTGYVETEDMKVTMKLRNINETYYIWKEQVNAIVTEQ